MNSATPRPVLMRNEGRLTLTPQAVSLPGGADRNSDLTPGYPGRGFVVQVRGVEKRVSFARMLSMMGLG